MAEIDAKLVAELRRRTGLPMMKCKEALQATAGDLAAAEDHLRKLGLKTADKVKEREMKEGLVFVHEAPGVTAAVALRCQTDFVARSADFVAFGKELAEVVAVSAPKDVGAGADVEPMRLRSGRTVGETIREVLVPKIGENIAPGAFARFRSTEGVVAKYLHHNGKAAALVELSGKGIAGRPEVAALGYDLCMHVVFHAEAAALRKEDLDPAWIAKEREIFAAQASELPENKRAAITEGKLQKRLREVVLLEQPFVKDESRTVRQQVEAVAKGLGTTLEIRRFARISAGA
jgi:elongation factor Ts